jgi:hypothetical protein
MTVTLYKKISKPNKTNNNNNNNKNKNNVIIIQKHLKNSIWVEIGIWVLYFVLTIFTIYSIYAVYKYVANFLKEVEHFDNENGKVKTNKIIIPDIIGGLGNQLFVVAAAYVFSKKSGHVLTLDSRNDVFSYGKPRPTYNDTVFYQIPVIDKTTINLDTFTKVNESEFSSLIRTLDNSNGNIDKYAKNDIFLTGGYYQNPDYYKDYYNDLLQLFKPNNDTITEIKNILKQNNINLDTDHLIAIHIRLDDVYTPIDNDKRVFDQDEYDMIINDLEKYIGKNNNKIVKFLIFSNDIPKTKQIFSKCSEAVKKQTIYITNKDYIELSLLTMCNDYIASPSTFNWWGIYLNDKHNFNKDSKIYIYWKRDSDYRKDFYNKYTIFSNVIPLPE